MLDPVKIPPDLRVIYQRARPRGGSIIVYVSDVRRYYCSWNKCALTAAFGLARLIVVRR